MIRVGSILVGALLALSAPLAAQQPSPDRTRCENKGHAFSSDTAIAACTVLLQSGRESTANRAVAYIYRGMAYRAKGDTDRAFADYNEAIGLNPKLAEAYNNRGNVHYDKREHDRAFADYNEAIRLNPKLAEAYNNRGNVYNDKREYDRAIADFNEAIRLNPSYADAYNNRGQAHAAKGDQDRAIADYNEAIRLNPSHAIAYVNRGRAYAAKGDQDRAIADYNEAIRLNPSYAAAYFNRGTVLLYTGSYARAQADFKQATDLAPKDAYTALWLDLAERRNGLPSHLKEVAAQLDMGKWPAPVVRLYTGELTPEQTLAAADHADPKTRREQVCEANFYGGALMALRERKDDAVRLLRLAAADCPRDFMEWPAARGELRLLGVEP